VTAQLAPTGPPVTKTKLKALNTLTPNVPKLKEVRLTPCYTRTQLPTNLPQQTKLTSSFAKILATPKALTAPAAPKTGDQQPPKLVATAPQKATPTAVGSNSSAFSSSLISRLKRSSAMTPSTLASTPSSTSLDRFTPAATFLSIKRALPGPLFAIENIAHHQLAAWEAVTTGKILAIPFSDKSQDPVNHPAICSTIKKDIADLWYAIYSLNRAVAKCITSALNPDVLEIAPPLIDPEVLKAKKYAVAFLVSNIPEADAARIVQQWPVVSSNMLTYHIMAFAFPTPDYISSIKGFGKKDLDVVRRIVLETWTSEAFLTDLEQAVASLTLDSPEPDEAYAKAIESLQVTEVAVLRGGAQDDTNHMLFIISASFTNKESW
jgi:hypothetical protein